jgi:hypothetical protein
VEIIVGTRDPGSTPVRGIPGKQAIGKMATKDINGTRDPGNKVEVESI